MYCVRLVVQTFSLKPANLFFQTLCQWYGVCYAVTNRSEYICLKDLWFCLQFFTSVYVIQTFKYEHCMLFFVSFVKVNLQCIFDHAQTKTRIKMSKANSKTIESSFIKTKSEIKFGLLLRCFEITSCLLIRFKQRKTDFLLILYRKDMLTGYLRLHH